MSCDRRKFFKLACLTALGIAAKPSFNVLSNNELFGSTRPSQKRIGKRWAMVIDLKKCQDAGDCHKCIDVCHQIHNVPDFGNPKDEIKWIWKEEYKGAFPDQEHEHLSSEVKNSMPLIFCNHCDNPPCVRVCPTQATFRRDSDGIVMMDQHRCIGCRYCIVACPYGSRSFNWRDPRPYINKLNSNYPTRTRGVVEKCNFCAERLAENLPPACVEVCTEKALVFGDLEDPNSEVRQLLASNYTIRRKPSLGTNPQIFYIV